MHVLRRNVAKLREYYLGLTLTAIGPSDILPRFFPSFRAYRDENGIVEFTYIKPLQINPTCVTFLAKTRVDLPRSFVVKFVQRYGAEAHRILAQHLAPQLLYFGQVGVLDGDPSYRDLHMVVMEYIDGTTLDCAKSLGGQILVTVEHQIKLALHHLHSNGSVFGNLRSPNVMITKNEEVMLIDFDWAGIHQLSRYPLLMSSKPR